MKHNGTLEELLDIFTTTLGCMIIGHKKLYFNNDNSSFLIGHKFNIIIKGGARLTIKWYLREKTLMIQGVNRLSRDRLISEWRSKVENVR